MDEPTFQGSAHATRTHKHTHTRTHKKSESAESLKGEIKDDESKRGEKKKDEKSTTALASMRGKWDMKHNVFLTYHGDNREADRAL